ncbi:unnamed protein product [Linum tenue]|uniref:Secreted protein n=1 Tax=Linum tenue TaxID=586396 RepID=A0AAV0S266_9ROSI|nr:unnamed protein product [Linum tenue]
MCSCCLDESVMFCSFRIGVMLILMLFCVVQVMSFSLTHSHTKSFWMELCGKLMESGLFKAQSMSTLVRTLLLKEVVTMRVSMTRLLRLSILSTPLDFRSNLLLTRSSLLPT